MDHRTEKRRVGDQGESLACDWLKKQDFSILERNYLTKFGEIDIIGQKSGQIVFFEVKTVTVGVTRDTNRAESGLIAGVSRENDWFDRYEPEDNIHPWKLKRIARTIEIYLSDKNVDDEVDWQLDCLSVYLTQEGKMVKIERVEDVF